MMSKEKQFGENWIIVDRTFGKHELCYCQGYDREMNL